MKHVLILISLFLFSCQNEKSDFIDFIDFDTYDERSSLVISAYLHDKSDCGEWGGHKERIRVFKSDDNWRLIYARDSNNCHIFFPNREETLIDKPSEFEFSPDITDLNELKSFIHKLEQYSPRRHLSSNATNSYSIKFSYGTVTKSYDIRDNSNDFTGYSKLRAYLLERKNQTD